MNDESFKELKQLDMVLNILKSETYLRRYAETLCERLGLKHRDIEQLVNRLIADGHCKKGDNDKSVLQYNSDGFKGYLDDFVKKAKDEDLAKELLALTIENMRLSNRDYRTKSLWFFVGYLLSLATTLLTICLKGS